MVAGHHLAHRHLAVRTVAPHFGGQRDRPAQDLGGFRGVAFLEGIEPD